MYNFEQLSIYTYANISIISITIQLKKKNNRYRTKSKNEYKFQEIKNAKKIKINQQNEKYKT